MPNLSPAELRVLGCLLEKQRTTPDAYPLSLNALRLACNQATNRDPVVAYPEGEVREAADRLGRHGLARLASSAGSRATKYRHLVRERLGLDDAAMAVLCVLLLRGPQTPGELRAHCARLHPFESREDVVPVLRGLGDAGLARWIPRRPGQKEDRCEHLLGEDTEVTTTQKAPAQSTASDATLSEVAPAQSTASDANLSEVGAAQSTASDASLAGTPASQTTAATLQTLLERVTALERDVQALRERLASDGG